MLDMLAEAPLVENMKAALRCLLLDPSVAKLCFSFTED